MTHSGGAVYVYGVLPAADAGTVAAEGIDGTRVRTVEHRDLAALVSDLESEALAAPAVRAHWRVLEAAAERATVLPVRFGTVMAGEAAVREELLEPGAQRLEGLLRSLAGRVQLRVKGTYDEDALLRAVVLRAPAIAALRERVRALPDDAGYYERISLGEMVASEIERVRADDEQRALGRLAPLAVGTRTEPAAEGGGAFDIAFLVERAGVDAFSRAVGELRAELSDRVMIKYVGPMPPYNFADAEATPEGAATWA